MRGTRGVLQNLSILTAGQVASQLLNVWALVFLADRLGAHWFGVVQIGVTFMSYALITAEWGMAQLGIREVSRLDDLTTVRRYVREHIGLMTAQAAVVIVLGLLLLPRLPFYATDPVVFVLYLLAVVPQVYLLAWVAIGLERMTVVGAAKSGQSLLYALFVLTLLMPIHAWTGAPAHQLVPLLFLAAMIGGSLIVTIPVSRWFGSFPWPGWPSLVEARRRWRETAPVGGSVIVLRILLNVDIIMLGLLATAEAAGKYAAASRVIFMLVVAIEVLWNALLPRFSRLARFDRAGHVRAFNLYLGCVLAGLLPVAVGGVLLGPELMDTLYGGGFPEAGPVFQLLAVSYTLLATGKFLGNTLISEDRQARYLPAVIAGAVVAVVGTATLIPRLGGFGAAVGMAASHVLLAAWLAVALRRAFRRVLIETLLLLVPALAFMGVVVQATEGWHVVPRVLVGGAGYLALAAWPLWRLVRRSRAAV